MDDITKLQTGLPASPVAYEELTVTAAAVSPSSINVERCSYAIFKMQNGPVRYRDDGTDPTSAVGSPLFNMDNLVLSLASMRKVRLIRTGATNGIARIRYYV